MRLRRGVYPIERGVRAVKEALVGCQVRCHTRLSQLCAGGTAGDGRAVNLFYLMCLGGRVRPPVCESVVDTTSTVSARIVSSAVGPAIA